MHFCALFFQFKCDPNYYKQKCKSTDKIPNDVIDFSTRQISGQDSGMETFFQYELIIN
jgi:hypothetical protein